MQLNSRFSHSSVTRSGLGAVLLPLGLSGSETEPVRSDASPLVAACAESSAVVPEGAWICGTPRTVECDRRPGTASPETIYVVRENGCVGVELSVAPGPFALGRTDVIVTERVASPSGGTELREVCRSELDVVDTVAPSAHPLHATLWPPNHELFAFTAVQCAGVADVCDPAPDVHFIDATSDEPADAEGDGSHSPDVAFDGVDAVSLRAERQGTGNGRVYSLAFGAVDRSGNATQGACTVEVPHDARGSAAVADPIAYRIEAPEH